MLCIAVAYKCDLLFQACVLLKIDFQLPNSIWYDKKQSHTLATT